MTNATLNEKPDAVKSVSGQLRYGSLRDKISGSLLGALVAVSASAATTEYHFIKDCTDWQSPDSYEEKVKPPASTETELTDIILPAGWTNEVSSAADYAYLSSLHAIQLPRGAGLLCRVDSGAQDLGCAVYTDWDKYWECGTLIKDGAGELRLVAHDKVVHATYNYHQDYFTDIHVLAGRAVLYPTETRSANCNLSCVTIDAGATFALGLGTTHYTRELSGDGTLAAEASSRVSYTVSCSQDSRIRTFAGKMTGNMGLEITGAINLTGLESDYTEGFSTSIPASMTNYVGIAKFGRKGGPGVVGAKTYYNAGYNALAAARFKYLGTGGDKPNHDTFVYGMDVTPFTIHGGPSGGFDATEWNLKNYSLVHGRFVLEGDDGSAANLFSLACFGGPSRAGDVNSVYKRGGGTWRLAAIGETASRTSYAGLLSVEGGILEAETIDGVGFPSALGFGLNKNYDWDTNTSTMVEVPYGIRLGGDDSATLAIGSGHSVPVLDRPIALRKGVSHLRNSTDGQPVMWKGFSAMEAGGSTLTLDGTCMATSTVASVYNGLGQVSVVKDGPGTWCLTGEQTFTGSLEAKAGTLILKKQDRSVYSWYRWVIRSFYGMQPMVELDQLAVYDADGQRLGKGATFNKYVAGLQPGECAWGFKYEVDGMYEDIGTLTNRGYRADGLFAGSTPMWVDKAQGGKNVYESCSIPLPQAPSAESAYTYFTVVQRLPAGSAVPAYLDICHRYSGPLGDWGAVTAVKDFALEASVDGFDWVTVYENTEAPLPSATLQHVWMSDSAADGWSTCGRNLTPNGTGGFTNGFEIPTAKRVPAGAAPAFLTGITGFKITAGATVVGEGGVTLPDGIAVKIDASGSDTASVTGVAFPENGTLEVTGIGKDATEIPVTFGDASYENLTKYKLTIGDRSRTGLLIARNGKLYIRKFGTALIIR